VARLPVLSGRDLVGILTGTGFEVVRRKGSHVSLRKGSYRTVVPLHNELSKGTLLAILKQCGLTRDELVELLK
jgi:predicted RNA binding protein YcfA (HicA-like mRNA interferase family)